MFSVSHASDLSHKTMKNTKSCFILSVITSVFSVGLTAVNVFNFVGESLSLIGTELDCSVGTV